MLRARICAAHMDGYLGPFFGRFSFNKGGLSKSWRKIVENGLHSAKFIIKVGMTASFGNQKRVPF